MNWPDICMTCKAGRWESAEAEIVYAEWCISTRNFNG